MFITGGSRGIGKAIGLKLAKDGANIVIAAKTVEKHPKLEGTIYSAAEEIEKAGGKALPIQCDLRDEQNVASAIEQAVKKFGGLDILVNNASAISITGTEDTPMKKYDLMNQINTRGTFMASKYALPHLRKSTKNPHILTLSPPLLMDAKWFKDNTAYAIAKYGMSMCVLGMAAEFQGEVGVNALWPRTMILTSALALLGGADALGKHARTPDIYADSAYVALSKDGKKVTGNFFIDEVLLREEGVTNFDAYAVKKGEQLAGDIFVPDHLLEGLISMT